MMEDDKEELIVELEAIKERLVKLKSQEQAVVDEEEALAAKLAKLQSRIATKDGQVARLWSVISEIRPFRTPWLLTLSLGRARFVLPERQRLRYKQEYEQFKLWTVGVQFVLSLLQLFYDHVLLDSLSNFHLVYYYSVLTLREHIMVANGSHIRAWWRAHHYLCVVIAGVLLIWPAGPAYTGMRPHLLRFAIYLSGVQVMQYRYQMRRLYTLRALARVGPMETTTESASVHIKNDLAFLLPFLLLGHVWQFYLARQFWLWTGSGWHVTALSVLLLLIGAGNLSTALYTVYVKYRSR